MYDVLYVPAPKNTLLLGLGAVLDLARSRLVYEWCMYDHSCVESEKGVLVEVQHWRVRCLALFNIKKSSLTLKHQKVKSNP